MWPTIVWLIIFLICGQVAAKEEEDLFDFGVCPESHPFAFESGKQCCSERSNWSYTFCKGISIDCESSSCKDYVSCCRNCSCSSITTGCSSNMTVEIENLSPDYDGRYLMARNLEANQPIFVGLDKMEGKCMWWHGQNRRWWIGLCNDIRDNVGFAYINEDLGCHSECRHEEETGYEFLCPEISSTWRRGGSNEGITGVTLTRIQALQATSAEDQKTNILSTVRFHFKEARRRRKRRTDPATARVNPDSPGSTAVGIQPINQGGTQYRQNCRPVFRNGKFVCL